MRTISAIGTFGIVAGTLAFELQGPQLKNKRFAHTCGHNCQSVPTPQQKLDCFLLSRAKGVEAEVSMERG